MDDVRAFLAQDLDQTPKHARGHAPCPEDVARLAGRQIVAIVDLVAPQREHRLEAFGEPGDQLQRLPLRPPLHEARDEKEHLHPRRRHQGFVFEYFPESVRGGIVPERENTNSLQPWPSLRPRFSSRNRRCL